MIVGAGTVVSLALAMTLVPFLRPASDDPRQADAVIVLSGDHGERLAVATRLLGNGVAATLVFAGTRDRVQEDVLCAAPPEGFEVVCLRPQPDSTRAEARASAQLAEQRGWRRIVVVTSDYHVTRSRLLFERCFDGQVDVVGGDSNHSVAVLARVVAHEWLAVGHALTVGRSC